MIIYLLGCLAALLLLILNGWLEYKFENYVCITVMEACVCTICVLVSWLGFLIILVMLLQVLLEEYGDQIIFKKIRE